MLRLFVLCFLSTEVYSQSESVGRAAYEARWLRLDTGARRSLWLAMLRAQRPVCMRASQFGVVSLHMFSALVQTAYSYYNVLIKMNSK
ncbi:odorant receptor 49b-like [Bacillus rossius redtenbacheri]|uniref:odorant receptor 49b-like n=1 Tax=Bacillus rossius redtenbacheri TaxID=93214 RepID=UPI002FDC7E75